MGPRGANSQKAVNDTLSPVKPQVNVGTIGHVGHGKTALTAAISKVMTERYGGEAVTVEQIENGPEERKRRMAIACAHVEYESAERYYAHVDCRTHTDCVKGMITGAAQMDGAILVVSSTAGPEAQTRGHILLSRQVGVRHIIVYLNDADLVDDPKLLDLRERQVRKLLSDYGYPGEAMPIISGSAVRALAGDPGPLGTPSILKLVEAMDRHFAEPKRAREAPFLMPIQDIFSISGRGTVLTGRIERGVINVGEAVEIVGIRPTQGTTVTGIEKFRKLLESGQAGENVGVLLEGIGPEQVERGQVLAKPGSITPHTHFECEVYMLSKKEGGRHVPFFNGYRPQFLFRTTDITGACELPEGVELVMPGDNVAMTVKLIAPIAMEKGLRFVVREGGRTVGVGVVTRILEDAGVLLDVLLVDPGPKRIAVIKAIRAATGLGLKDAKTLVESAPTVIAKGLVNAKATALRDQIEHAGGKVELTEAR